MKDFGLDIITLPSHTSHALQPLDVYYFKPFKTGLRKVRDVTMSRNNLMELNKVTVIGYVDYTLKQSLTKKNPNLSLEL